MILYNVTIGIDREIELAWLQWMRHEHIPAVLATGFFTHYDFYKVISHEDERTISYCVQYHSPDIGCINTYLADHGPKHMAENKAKFEGRHVAFHTLLEKVKPVGDGGINQ